MRAAVLEASYPITFQQKEAEKLGGYLRQRECINLVGMKKVGISNFLRFFLNHTDIIPTYISKKERHLFISVDLNDLVEQEIYPFWNLTLKRIVDACEQSTLSAKTKAKINDLFVRSIQFQDLFLVIDSIRHALVLIGENGIAPTIFFLRFDRLKDKFNPSFFDNLEGLRDATHGNLAYVFTSYRRLVSIFPGARSNLSIFSQTMYVKPVEKENLEMVYAAYKSKYHLSLTTIVEQALFTVTGGYIQYLQLGLIYLSELKEKSLRTEEDVLQALLVDERIILQSEELWESLTMDEKKILMQVAKKQSVEKVAQEKNKYLWDTGFICERGGRIALFSPLFTAYLLQIEDEEKKKKKTAHLTRKENALFTLLKEQIGEICEREEIIEIVWPEAQEFGVSDWAIDRLVARVRLKLREQQTPYEIQTIRTRGYKLTPLKQ